MASLQNNQHFSLTENIRNLKKNYSFTFYTIIFGQRAFIPIIKFVFQEKHEFYLFYYNTIFKDYALFK